MFPLQTDLVDQLFAEPFIKINLQWNVHSEIRLIDNVEVVVVELGTSSNKLNADKPAAL